MNAIVLGAGNIGRGFVGLLLSRAGCTVAFVDVDKALVAALNKEGCYPVQIVQSHRQETVWARSIRGVDGNDQDAVALAIADSDLVATAVGVNALSSIVPGLVAGIRLRRQKPGKKPLNILLCENLLGVDEALRARILDYVAPEEGPEFLANVALVETAVGRMVPTPTPSQRGADPLLIRVEPYNWLPYNQDAFLGTPPAVARLVPFSPFGFLVQRKLFLHNMGHATCAYLGLWQGKALVWEAMEDPWIHLCVQNAMLEVAVALERRYRDAGIKLSDLVAHSLDLVFRFQNRALRDSNHRVGADPRRKLAPDDRLLGAAKLVLDEGETPVFVAVGIAAGLAHGFQTLGAEMTVDSVLVDRAGWATDHGVVGLVKKYLTLIQSGADPKGLFQAAEEDKADLRPDLL